MMQTSMHVLTASIASEISRRIPGQAQSPRGDSIHPLTIRLDHCDHASHPATTGSRILAIALRIADKLRDMRPVTRPESA